MTFQAHINVEFCGATMLIKYLFKYISKGTDRVAARISRPVDSKSQRTPQLSQPVDEIQNFIDALFICPHEACWRILNFPIHYRDPAVQILAVHLEIMQLLKFHERQPLQSIVENAKKKKKKKKQPSLNGSTIMHRLLSVVTSHTLTSRPNSCGTTQIKVGGGCRSFEDIRTVNEIVHQTYRCACEAIGLLGDDKEWAVVLQECSVSATCSELRSLFAHILAYCDVTNPLALSNEHWKLISDDIPLRASKSLNIPNLHINDEELRNYVLYEIEIQLNQCSKSISDCGLPGLPPNLLLDLANRLIMEERNYDRQSLNNELIELEGKMNAKQREIYELVTSASYNHKSELTFVYGHGGTVKTFLWKAIITALRARGKIVLAVASSGIASLLLPSGRTAHSRFKLLLVLTDETMCNIKKTLKWRGC
ncbi:uncharacterized protein [Rutidosis leptorrhynchoides]|uniref:uncharacterized protein n=1 Tax=Rutidosis leptorrhynchoides TaxID=125765 RepID=UPI003A99E08D